jgi:predicted class III extradiol MEMO1 family dioxygenase
MYDSNQFAAYIEDIRDITCGRTPMLIMMNCFPGMLGEWPPYSHSSDIASKNDSAVSYLVDVNRTEQTAELR